MKIACVLITHLPAKSEVRRRPELLDRPVIVAAASSKGATVLDFSSQVRGVTVGMPLQEAVSRCSSATLVEADEPYYRNVFAGTVEALMQRSPIVEAGELGCVFVGVTGLETMYRGEVGLISALLDAVPEVFNPRIGVAETKFPAYVAAMKIDGGRALRVPEDVGTFLRDVSIDLLPMSWDDRTRLHEFGLHTMGQVASQSVGAMQSQFGANGKAAWELSNGVDRRPLSPVRQQEEVSESLAFPVPATNLFAIVPALEVLLGRAFGRSGVRGKYFRRASMEASVMNRAPWTKHVVFKSPVDSREKAIFALKNTLEGIELPGALEDLTLILSEATGQSGIQSSLFEDVRKQEQLREMMSHLHVRLRVKPPIYKIMEVEPWSRIPERKQALVQFTP